ncbi:MAG: deoxyribose-phosphate aldolase [Candidatus Gastranaerophilaceae bacterium]|jgi:deoxyribose-phosphate aldolase|nr:deoxyribose-phosphate aldolase [Clostridium sp.]
MSELSKYIEHTLLKQDAKKEELQKLFEEAKQYGFLGVCVNPCNIKFAKENLKNSDVKIVTVVGFPLGANLSEVKAFETELAIKDGADEIDMVINVSKLKDRDYDFVQKDIEAVKKACGNTPLKVILETDLLTSEEIKKACELCVAANADFVKTSTGFVKNGVGAKAEDVELMAAVVKPHGLGVKASAGIRDKEKALAMVKAGADRLGTSSGVAIVS